MRLNNEPRSALQEKSADWKEEDPWLRGRVTWDHLETTALVVSQPPPSFPMGELMPCLILSSFQGGTRAFHITETGYFQEEITAERGFRLKCQVRIF